MIATARSFGLAVASTGDVGRRVEAEFGAAEARNVFERAAAVELSGVGNGRVVKSRRDRRRVGE